MTQASPFLAVQEVERHIRSILRSFDTDTLDPDEKKAAAMLRRLTADARLDIRDYELSETRPEQLKCAVAGRNRLEMLVACILASGALFGPADVAQLGARCEQIRDNLI